MNNHFSIVGIRSRKKVKNDTKWSQSAGEIAETITEKESDGHPLKIATSLSERLDSRKVKAREGSIRSFADGLEGLRISQLRA